MDLNKLKVPELRRELQSRGLESKGNKPVLIERLREAIEQENAENGTSENEEEAEVASSEENSLMYTTADSDTTAPIQDTNVEDRDLREITSTAAAPESSPVKETQGLNITDTSPKKAEPERSEVESEFSSIDQHQTRETPEDMGHDSLQISGQENDGDLHETKYDVPDNSFNNVNDSSERDESSKIDDQFEDSNTSFDSVPKSGFSNLNQTIQQDLSVKSDGQIQDSNTSFDGADESDLNDLPLTSEQDLSVKSDGQIQDSNTSFDGADASGLNDLPLTSEQDLSVKSDGQIQDSNTSFDGADDLPLTSEQDLSVKSDGQIQDSNTSFDSADESGLNDLPLTSEQGQSVINDAEIQDNDSSFDNPDKFEYPKPNETKQHEDEVQNLNEKTMDVAEPIKVPELDVTFSKEDIPTEETPMDTSEDVGKDDEERTSKFEDNFATDTIETPEGDSAAEEPKKRVRKSRFDQPGENNESNECPENYNTFENERKRKHSPSPSGDHSSCSGYEAPSKIAKQDDEPSFDDNEVLLSWYDSDLNLTVNKENFLSAVPLSESNFMYMWAGARSTYGFQSGKVYFDVKLVEKNSVNPVDEFELYSFRVGWSVAYSSRQLGEAPLSYGYDSSGKKCVDNTFEEYGQPFNVEDVIGCLVDFESSTENVSLSFTFNGVSQNTAFEIPKEQLEGKTLFPHILSKNISFEVNFGDRAESWDLQEKFEGDFEWASKVPLGNRVKGPRKPDEKKDCEVIMMCGLPCCGKTTWIKKHLEENVEKLYNVIGIDDILSKMKVADESIEKYYKDNTNSLVEKCLRLIERMLDLASVRWRNYILDQPNIAIYVQRRRMRLFEGFTRNAVVILPKEDDYDKYQERWDENSLRDTTSALMELKSNFRLPEVGDLFENVTIEGIADCESAEELIRKYNKEGRDARPRDDRYSYRSRDADRYGRPTGGAGYRSRWMDRGPPPSMGRGGGWGGYRGMDRMPPSGYRDRPRWRDRPDDDRDYRNRYPPRDQGGRYGGGGGGGGGMMSGGNSGNRWGGRDRDRMGPPPRSAPPPSGPNPLMGPLMGAPGIDDIDDSDKGTMGEDDRKRPSRFSDGPHGGYRGRGGGGFRGRGGDRSSDSGRPMGNRFGGPFRPNNGSGPRGGPGGGYRGRDEGSSRFYGGRGGQQGRDGRDSRNNGGSQRPGSGPLNRFDKRDSNSAAAATAAGNKSDSTTAGTNQQQSWGMYGQGNWNQYQNWAQYQQAGYSPQQIQQYWSQMQQQQQQQQQQAQQNQQTSQQGSKPSSGPSPNSTNSSNAKSGSTNTNPSQSNTNAGYNTQAQGYNTQAYNAQGYDANTYAQYCAYYSQLAAQQGWQQNADGTYTYPQGAWAQYGYNYAAAAGGGTNNATGGASGGTTTTSNTGTSGASGSSNVAVSSK